MLMRKRLKNSESSEHLTHKVPFSQKAYFGISIAGVSFIQSMIDGSMLKYYTDFILFPSFLFGVAQLIFGLWNALNDPLIGYFSDKILSANKRITRKRWLYISIPFISVGYFSIILVNPEIPTAIIGIKIGVSIVPIIFLLSAFFFLWFFPLKGKKLEQLKKVSRKLYDERLG